ncbi:ShlB/FhaC/HecB family hemolysin secretion/activation protein [Luteimonas sp. MC1572]|uniref:ShlB/FhaC/HecB family hemolysin secretion/activation protein n=1 Tax=Luteimonas sp. MC1572 TaxID=2799325 RepID=UPI0018F0FA30|nr:ShlB/FhaC/HecB family hemolysin secretion/activation protein [Luteimonas sp. MC1572]MBJ6981655.1 ShlB/FhaC/HecB family hemolysin secretion/activation protein [Luteimonas sp. MC1572]QQO02948.1 ShlB/FhaC/HecB family hemolysin secretion/activation protein [Luteimonas sp. MC1572]
MKLLPLMLLAISHGAVAQQIPGAGSQLRQLPTPPPAQAAQPQIRIEDGIVPAAAAADAPTVLVERLQVTGASAWPASELVAIAEFTPGTRLTLAQLQAMAARITRHYRDNGYFVARAWLPAQDVTSNSVTIAVSEGVLGQVTLRNQSNLADNVAQSRLAGLESGDALTIDPIEQRLLLLSDIPGVVVQSTMVPGQAPGSSDLVVDITPGRRVTGSVDADNAGNPYTGEYRLGATVNLNNPLGRGDVASLRLLTSGSGLTYGRGAYQMLFGRATAGVAYSRLEYELGEQYDDLGAHGTADIASVFGSIPLIRSRGTNLYAGLQYDHRRFEDRIDLFDVVTDKRARVATASLYGNHYDGFGGGGANAFHLALSSGDLDIQTPSARAVDAVTARAHGGYTKLALNVSRLQRLTDLWSLYGALGGQVASGNLDASEKLVLGGMDGVRAYPQGEGFGDEGLLANLEVRRLLPGLSGHVPGQVHLLGFVDGGRITVDKDPWFAGDNTRSLSGAGIGATWDDPGNFAVRSYYARKVGGEDALSAPDRSGRFWIQAIKYF